MTPAEEAPIEALATSTEPVTQAKPVVQPLKPSDIAPAPAPTVVQKEAAAPEKNLWTRMVHKLFGDPEEKARLEREEVERKKREEEERKRSRGGRRSGGRKRRPEGNRRSDNRDQRQKRDDRDNREQGRSDNRGSERRDQKGGKPRREKGQRQGEENKQKDVQANSDNQQQDRPSKRPANKRGKPQPRRRGRRDAELDNGNENSEINELNQQVNEAIDAQRDESDNRNSQRRRNRGQGRRRGNKQQEQQNAEQTEATQVESLATSKEIVTEPAAEQPKTKATEVVNAESVNDSQGELLLSASQTAPAEQVSTGESEQREAPVAGSEEKPVNAEPANAAATVVPVTGEQEQPSPASEVPEETVTSAAEGDQVTMDFSVESSVIEETPSTERVSSEEMPKSEAVDTIVSYTRASNDPRSNPKPVGNIDVKTIETQIQLSSPLDTALTADIAHNPRPLARPHNDPRLSRSAPESGTEAATES